MSFKDKYDESIQIADYAYNNNNYNVATNRYYYAIFQKILNVLGEENIKVKFTKDNAVNSHVETIGKFREEILCKNKKGKERVKQNVEFNKAINKMKKFRHKADYEEDFIDNEDIKKVKSSFNYLDKII